MFVIGTAGHVDHGKSLLVQALTGIDPDRLEEEKVRGMTIDLGFAWLTLPSSRTVSIVDVPGHERFIKNMLAGVGGTDLALLVIAADDGVMPQTLEHLAILDLLGVSSGVAAITKVDLVDGDWLALVSNDVREILAGTTLEGSPLVACSSVTGAGLSELTATLDAALDRLPAKPAAGAPRLPIDRVFTISGFGTVVTGTLIDGEIAVGDELEVVPGGRRARVRGLQSHKTGVDRALPGTRTAVNLGRIDRDDLRRGLVLAPPGSLRATSALDVRLRAVSALPHPLRHNMMLTLHVGAAEAPAQLRLLDADELRGGDECWAQLKLATEVAVRTGDRFVLRTPNDTVGGGMIVQVSAGRHRRRDARIIERLHRHLHGSPVERVFACIVHQPFITRDAVLAAGSIEAIQADDALTALTDTRVTALIVSGEQRYLTREHEDALRVTAASTIEAFHSRHPLRSGMPLEDLRSHLHVPADVLAALMSRWHELRVLSGNVALSSFAPMPSAEDQKQIDVYRAALRANPANPPPSQLPPELLAFAIQSGGVIDAGAGIVFDAEAFEAMTDALRKYVHAHGSISLAQARDLFGTSRRFAQAFLEHLDRLRVTRRIAEERVLR